MERGGIAGGISRLDAGDTVKKRNDLIVWKKQQVNNHGDDENHQEQDHQSFRLVHLSVFFYRSWRPSIHLAS